MRKTPITETKGRLRRTHRHQQAGRRRSWGGVFVFYPPSPPKDPSSSEFSATRKLESVRSLPGKRWGGRESASAAVRVPPLIPSKAAHWSAQEMRTGVWASSFFWLGAKLLWPLKQDITKHLTGDRHTLYTPPQQKNKRETELLHAFSQYKVCPSGSRGSWTGVQVQVSLSVPLRLVQKPKGMLWKWNHCCACVVGVSWSSSKLHILMICSRCCWMVPLHHTSVVSAVQVHAHTGWAGEM